jgi:hypothetical protein
LTFASCAPNPIYLVVKSARDPEFRFYKTQTIKVVSPMNPTVSEKVTKAKIEDWMAYKNYRLLEKNPNYVLLVYGREFEGTKQALKLIPNFTRVEARSENSIAISTSIQTSAIATERKAVFKTVNLHLYRTSELEKYFLGQSVSVSPVWEATCTTEIDDMEGYERKLVGMCMKAFPKSFKGTLKIRR